MKRVSVCLGLIAAAHAGAQETDGAAAMAAALQDPLANISAVMTDNEIFVGTGSGQATTVLQIQPVYSLPFEKFSLVPRAIIPIIGLAPEAKIPPVINPAPSGESTRWGLGDTAFQLFWAPKTSGNWKWGVGPQVSLKTHTRSSHAGAQWGGGLAGVLVGNLTENISSAFILGHMEGQDGFSVTLFQPQIFYNFSKVPGLAISYNGAITYDHNISSGDKLQLPLGLNISQTTDLGGGYGLDLLIGAYGYPVKPDGGPDWSLKFGITLLMPR